jgi:FlaA1/EpsC-like NDP-sugar epimerase
LALWISLYLRLGEFVYLDAQYVFPILASLSLALPIFIVNGLYRAIFRYSAWPALMTVAKSISIYGILFSILFSAIGFSGVPRTVGLIQPILLFILIGISRSTAYYWLGEGLKQRRGATARERVLIYGAGAAGRQIAAALSDNRDMRVVGFIDDDNRLTGQVLNGLTIYHSRQLANQARRLNASLVLLAIPSVSGKRRQEILDAIQSASLSARTLPSVADLAQGKISVSDIRELNIDDLLGREPATPNDILVKQNISNRVVMVTGAGGSIGGELCRQIIRLNPLRIILVEHSEFALYQIVEELLDIKNRFSLDAEVISPILASVTNLDALERIFLEYSPQTVYHAAAYKHLPLVEQNAIAGILNNVFGTKILTDLAVKHGVSNFVLISTDKAVRTTNVMGATKRWAELVVQNCAAQAIATGSNQKFCAVRFGNVLGSSGSVVPLFRSQISKGGPITLTHSDVTRYFMSIEEAVALVLQAGSISDGGEIFLLDMGEPIKIYELAKSMIRLSGYSIRDQRNPDGDIEIIVTGLRPGEKLYEELLINLNSAASTLHPKIYKAREPILTNENLNSMLNKLDEHIKNDDTSKLIELLMSVATETQ